MIQITPQMRVLVAIKPVDFRKGIDGMARVCREALTSDPFSGAAYVFRNRRCTAIKILIYDGQGFWLAHKRMSKGRFRGWPNSTGRYSMTLTTAELQVLFFGGDPAAARTAPMWRRVNPEE